jgi:hypothetical protein
MARKAKQASSRIEEIEAILAARVHGPTYPLRKDFFTKIKKRARQRAKLQNER